MPQFFDCRDRQAAEVEQEQRRTARFGASSRHHRGAQEPFSSSRSMGSRGDPLLCALRSGRITQLLIWNKRVVYIPRLTRSRVLKIPGPAFISILKALQFIVDIDDDLYP